MERFLPGCHLIESFGNGGFRMGGVSHQGSILATPSGMRALPVASIKSLLPQHVAQLIDEKNAIDMVVISTGRDAASLPAAVVRALQENGIGYEVMTTHAAVRLYNVVLEEHRRVAAILIAVDNVVG